MRRAAIVALACACGGSRPPPFLFDPLPADQIRVDFAAIDHGPFRFKIGARAITPKLTRKQLGRVTLVRGKFGTGTVTLARVGTRVSGVVRDGKTGFEIMPVLGGHRLVPRSWKTARQPHDNDWDQHAAQRGPRPPPTLAQTKVEVSVLFAFTPEVLKKLGDLDGVSSHIEAAMEELNLACDEAKTNMNFVALVAPEATKSTEGTRTVKQLYYALQGKTDFDDAHVARKSARADIVVLLVDRPNDELGRAVVMGQPTTAVGVVYWDTLWDMTIAHELGHVMGGWHDTDQDDKPYPFGHGFLGTSFRTILTNPCSVPENCPLVPEWSRPPDYGTEHWNNNALLLKTTGAAVSTFGDQL